MPEAERAAMLDEVLAGRSRVYGAERRGRDGQALSLSVALSPLRDADGEITGVVSVARDNTVVVQAETKASDAAAREAALLDELHQTRRLESIGQLAGGVAHDFNNLLGVIINYAQFVLDDLPEESPAREDVEEIRRAARRGADLTRQLLIFSRREVVRPEVFNVNDLVADLQSLLRRALGERVELRTQLGGDVWRVRADRGQLEQVLVNLAVNGRDAMPEGGSLDLETSNVTIGPEQSAQHAELDAGDYVLVRVTDHGVGMSPEVMERAFEPFFTTKPKGQGTGLGLATVYGIVKEAGGRVALYSEPGFGTAVKVYLPATDAPTARAAGDSGDAPRARGETVLVVEDQDDVRRMAERILADAGYDVLATASGEEALALVSGRRVDLLLTDVIMPGILGPELAQRARRADPALKVVFMSGYSDRVLSGDALTERDGTAFIEKPFSGHELRAKIRQALDRS
jgi:signal transduction histidine kinase/CheY-like chemotaxis protein